MSRRSLFGERASVSSRHRASSTGTNIKIQPNGSLAAAASAAADELLLSSSYVWMVAVMSEFLAEVWILLQAANRDGESGTPMNSPMHAAARRSSNITPFGGTGKLDDPPQPSQQVPVYPEMPSANRTPSSSASVQYYSRDDVCEIEPEIVSCLLRIVVRYVRDVESAVPVLSEIELDEDGEDNFDAASFSQPQRECYLKTIEAVKEKLIPTLNDVIWTNFFSDGSVLVLNPPKNILDRLAAKVDEMVAHAKSTWVDDHVVKN